MTNNANANTQCCICCEFVPVLEAVCVSSTDICLCISCYTDLSQEDWESISDSQEYQDQDN